MLFHPRLHPSSNAITKVVAHYPLPNPKTMNPIKGYHYFGMGSFHILLGKAFADTMLELSGHADKVLPPKLNAFAPPIAPAAK